MKKLCYVFVLLMLSGRVFAQSITTVSAVDLQPASTDFTAVSISNLYDPFTREFKVVASTLAQTTGHNVAGFYVQIDVYDYNNLRIVSTFNQIANTASGSIAPYTTFSSDYAIDYSTNSLTYIGPVVIPAGALKIVYRVISLNDPDLDNVVDSNDISTIEYTTVTP